MKYTILEEQELAKLEKEFVDFLVINGITASDWTNIQQDAERAQGIIEAFSDVVWEGVLQRSRYIVRAAERLLFVFSFGESQAQLFLVSSSKPIERLEDWLKEKDVKIDFQTKSYDRPRSQEIFEIIQNGGLISDGTEYRHFSLIWAEDQA